MRQRLAELRGPAVAPRPLDARALAALAANPGCRRRALLDGAGVDKGALAQALGSPAPFGQSQFAFVRGNVFEARVKADGGADLLRLLHERLGGGAPAPEPDAVRVPDLAAAGPQGRAARTALALEEACAGEAEGGWSLLDHPMVALDVAGSPAYLEPDAVVVHPDGSWTVVEIKSFPMLDGSADSAKVGAAARQAAVYVLALEAVAERMSSPSPGPLPGGGRVRRQVLLVCPKDFSNLPAAEAVDVRKQLSVTRRQLVRLTRLEEIAAALPEGTTFDLRPADDEQTPTRPVEELTAAVESVPAAYAPECLAACELAFHCRRRAREAGAVEALGRGVRGELGGLTTVEGVLAAALVRAGSGAAARASEPAAGSGAAVAPPALDPAQAGPDSPTGPVDATDPTVAALRRAAALRAEALAAGALAAGAAAGGPAAGGMP
ncbi:hypothetical protein QMK28_02480 [Streptomyces sp. H27-D2]|nr:hypothetical protein [Streptomyces sp. H27-D2]MEC4015212.1 hypothetical protein [Streptomyces sp. H27-D2]